MMALPVAAHVGLFDEVLGSDGNLYGTTTEGGIHDTGFIDTAGLRKDCKEIYPSPRIVQLAAQIGVPITFGSDAHAPEEVGTNFTEATRLARSVGYHECCRFARRECYPSRF